MVSEQNGNEAHTFKVFDGHGRVIASASSHPGSSGGFSGQLVLYDNLGRAIKQSNPTETSASGTPSQWSATGDDLQAGWLYTQQTYDWKGRPLVTTNTDLTTKEASYAGCGCAGGEVVTLTDEGTMDAGVPKRRQQKIYADVLGRTVRTEVLNWQGGSVYSTTVNSYNARDQITSATRYQGDISAPHQESAMTYDGHGRLASSKTAMQMRPITYVYNADDTLWKVLTPREATRGTPEDVTTTFTYNNRRLPRRIEHTVPANLSNPSSTAYVAPTSAVEFDYDSAGNRLWMSDGLGRVDYSYDTLSRLLSETRTFNDPANPSIINVVLPIPAK